MSPSCAPAPTVLVLASGRGERFLASGGTVHKLQARLGNATVLAHTLAAVQASGLRWHVEDAGHPGMGDSIAAAVRATRDAPGWLVLPADLPLVLPATLQRVAAALAAGGVTAAQPVYQGQRGHPVGFAAACRDALLALEGNQGAAPVLRAQHAMNLLAMVAVDDVGVLTDVDTLEDLAHAEALWRERAAAAPAQGDF